jgi:hypothetical protein
MFKEMFPAFAGVGKRYFLPTIWNYMTIGLNDNKLSYG